MDRGEDAERQQVEGSDPVEVLHQGHDTHLEFQFWGTPWGAGAVRLDKLWIPESERCIDQRFRTAALRFRTCEICLSRAETAARAAGRPNLSAAMARQRRVNQPQTHANRHERALPTGIGSPGAARLRTGRWASPRPRRVRVRSRGFVVQNDSACGPHRRRAIPLWRHKKGALLAQRPSRCVLGEV